jgi:protein TonB
LGAKHAQAAQSPGSGGRASARFLSNQPPIYPAEAIRQRLEGEVLLNAEVAATGEVTQISIARSSGHPILDAAALTAVRNWRFQPAHENQVPVASLEVLPVKFRFPTQ